MRERIRQRRSDGHMEPEWVTTVATVVTTCALVPFVEVLIGRLAEGAYDGVRGKLRKLARRSGEPARTLIVVNDPDSHLRLHMRTDATDEALAALSSLPCLGAMAGCLHQQGQVLRVPGGGDRGDVLAEVQEPAQGLFGSGSRSEPTGVQRPIGHVRDVAVRAVREGWIVGFVKVEAVLYGSDGGDCGCLPDLLGRDFGQADGCDLSLGLEIGECSDLIG